MPTLPSEPSPPVYDLRVDADHFAGGVDQRAAGVARVDRRVGLDHVVDRHPVGGLDFTLQGGDDAAGHGPLQVEGVADRDHRVADFHLRRSRPASAGGACDAGASTFSSARSEFGSVPTTSAGYICCLPIRSETLDFFAAFDDVVVGEDVAFVVEDDAGAGGDAFGHLRFDEGDAVRVGLVDLVDGVAGFAGAGDGRGRGGAGGGDDFAGGGGAAAGRDEARSRARAGRRRRRLPRPGGRSRTGDFSFAWAWEPGWRPPLGAP